KQVAPNPPGQFRLPRNRPVGIEKGLRRTFKMYRGQSHIGGRRIERGMLPGFGEIGAIAIEQQRLRRWGGGHYFFAPVLRGLARLSRRSLGAGREAQATSVPPPVGSPPRTLPQ